MKEFKSIKASEFDYSPFRVIGDEWMLITTEHDGIVNTMTASWGGLGVMWNTNVVYSVIRDSRFTKELLDESTFFSISFLNHSKYLSHLGYFGSVSGRDEDKIKTMNLTIQHKDGIPYIEESEKVILCRKMCAQKIEKGSLIEKNIFEQYYSDEDYHTLYIGGIEEIMIEK